MSAATTLRGRLQPLTGCAFVRQSVVYPAVELQPADPLSTADRTRVGVLIFSTAIPDEYTIVEIPGLVDLHLMATGPGAGILINPDDPALLALAGQLAAGAWCNPWGAQITALEAAFLQIRP